MSEQLKLTTNEDGSIPRTTENYDYAWQKFSDDMKKDYVAQADRIATTQTEFRHEPGNRPVPRETAEDQALFDSLDTEVFGAQPETNVETDQTPTTELGNMVRGAADRIDWIVTNGAEKYENGKAIVKQAGASALRVAKTTSVAVLELSTIGTEAAGDAVTAIKKKVIVLAKTARIRFTARREARRAIKRYEMESEAEAMNTRFNEETEAEAMNKRYDEETEADAMNTRYNEETEAEAMNKRYDIESEAEAMNTRYNEEAEAEKMNDAFDEERHQAELRAEAARLARAERRARWANRYEGARNTTSEVWTKAKSLFGKFGRGALKAFKALKQGGKAALGAAGGMVAGAVVGAAKGATRGAAVGAKAGWNS